MSKYRLKKDTIGNMAGNCWVIGAGEELILIEGGNRYITKSGWYFEKSFVESHPEWFELIPEVSKDGQECVFDADKINQRIDFLNEIRDAERKAFNAAREIWADDFKVPDCQNKYKDFEEYKSKENDKWYRHVVDSFKQSKSPSIPESKERIEVQDFFFGHTPKGFGSYHLVVNNVIPKEKYQAIRSAIESVLNNDEVYLNLNVKHGASITTSPNLYTQEYVDKVREQTWNAARNGFKVQIPFGRYNYGDFSYHYPTLNDYINSLNKKEQ